ncbi:toxin glutamine deamidase domain-containing protein, partial [Kitasatospora sp. Root187]|uniref:toxin glutamine deamidase domain-containing protein n=2 Tax=unclassified Kitasatospora TaxID=2633591 RepID=UPI002100BDF7
SGDRTSIKDGLGRPSSDGPSSLPDSIYRQNVSGDQAKALIGEALNGATPPRTFPAGSDGYTKILATDNGDSTKRIVDQFNGMRQQQNAIKQVVVLQDDKGNYQLRFDVDKTAPAPAPTEGGSTPRSATSDQVSSFGSPDRSATGDASHARMTGYLGKVDSIDAMVVKKPENVFALKADQSLDEHAVTAMFDVEMTSDGYKVHPDRPESEAPVAGAKFKTAFGYTEDGRSFAIAVESYRYNGEKDANGVRIRPGVPYFASDVFLTQWQAVETLAAENGPEGIKPNKIEKQLGKNQPVAVPTGLPDSIYRQNISGTAAKVALVSIMGADAGPYNRVATPEQAARLLTETQNGSSTQQIVDQFNDVSGRQEGERLEISQVLVIREANGSFHLRLDVQQEAPVAPPANAQPAQGQVPPVGGFGSPEQVPLAFGRTTPTTVPDGSLPKGPATPSAPATPPHQPAPGHGNGSDRKRGRDEEPDETPDKWRRTPAYENSDGVLTDRGYLPASDDQYDALANHTKGTKFPEPTKELLDLVDPHKVPVTPPPGFKPGSDLHNCLEGVEAYRDTHFGRPRPSGQTFTGEAELGVASVLNKRHDVPHLFGKGQPAVDDLIAKVQQGGPGSFATVMVGKEGAEGHALALVNLPPQGGKPGGPHWVDTSKKTSWPAEPGALPDRRAGDWKVWASAVDGREQTLPGMTPDQNFREHFGANDSKTPEQVQAEVKGRVATLAGLMDGGEFEHSTFKKSPLVNGFLQDGGTPPLKFHQIEQKTSDYEEKAGNTADGAPEKGAQFTNAYGFDADGRGSALMMENYKAETTKEDRASGKAYFASDGFFTQWAAVHPGGRTDVDIEGRLANPSALEIPDSLPENIYRQNVSGFLAKTALQDALAGGGHVSPEPASPFTRKGEREGWLNRQKEQGVEWGQEWQDRLDQSTPGDREKLQQWKQWVDQRAADRAAWTDVNPHQSQERDRPLLVRMTPDQSGFQEILGKTVNGKTTSAIVNDFNLMKPDHRAEITAITVGRDKSGNLSLRFEVQPVAGGSFGSPDTDTNSPGSTADRSAADTTGPGPDTQQDSGQTPVAPSGRARPDIKPAPERFGLFTDYMSHHDGIRDNGVSKPKKSSAIAAFDPAGASDFDQSLPKRVEISHATYPKQEDDPKRPDEPNPPKKGIGSNYTNSYGVTADGRLISIMQENYRYPISPKLLELEGKIATEKAKLADPVNPAPESEVETAIEQAVAEAAGHESVDNDSLGDMDVKDVEEFLRREKVAQGITASDAFMCQLSMALDADFALPAVRKNMKNTDRIEAEPPTSFPDQVYRQNISNPEAKVALAEIGEGRFTRDDDKFGDVLKTANGKTTKNAVATFNELNGLTGDQRVDIGSVEVKKDANGNFHLKFDIVHPSGDTRVDGQARRPDETPGHAGGQDQDSSPATPDQEGSEQPDTADAEAPAPAPRALKDVLPTERMADYFANMGDAELYTVKEQNLPALKVDPTKTFSGATIFGVEQESTDYAKSTENAAAGRPIAGGRFATAFGCKDGKSFAVAMETYRYDGKAVLDGDGNVIHEAGPEAPYFASEAFLTQWQAAESGNRTDAETALTELHENGPTGMPDSIYRQNISGGPAKATLDLLVHGPVVQQAVDTSGRDNVLTPSVIAEMGEGKTLSEAIKGKKLEQIVQADALPEVEAKLPTTLVGHKGDAVFAEVLKTDNGKSTNNIVKQFNSMRDGQLAISQVMVIKDGTNYHLRLDIEPAPAAPTADA